MIDRLMPFGFAVLVTMLSVAGVGSAAADQRLLDAAERNSVASVEALLSEGVDVTLTQPDGATALHWAAYWDNVETAERLIHAGASVDAANDLDVTPLALACRNGSVAMVETLLRAGADASTVGHAGETVLITCARTGRLEPVAQLLAAGADPNAKEHDGGQTALMWAAAGNHTSVVRALVEGGADLGARSDGRFTPLLFAAREGALDSGRFLVEAGGDVNALTPGGHSPLLVAAASIDAVTGSDYRLVVSASQHEALAVYLVEHAADVHQADEFGMTALHFAVETGKMALLEVLLEVVADPNVRLTQPLPFRRGDYVSRSAYDGASPFWLAARLGEVEMMRRLVAAGADATLPSATGVTPLMVAAGLSQTDSRMVAQEKLLEAVTYLVVELGADVHAGDARGRTALHGAANTSADSIIRILVDQGAVVDAPDRNGRTPLDFALSPRRPRPVTAALLRELAAEPR